MRDALCSTYISVLKFWDLAYSKFTSNGKHVNSCTSYLTHHPSSALKKLVHSLSSRTLTKLNESITNIQESVDVIAKEGDLIEKAKAEAFREGTHISRLLGLLSAD